MVCHSSLLLTLTRVLDGGITSRFKEIGLRHWKVPMNLTSNGSIIAQDVFQRKLDSIFLGVPGVTGIADDMIIYSRDYQEHDGNELFGSL